jgi:hypothetical protein
MTKTKEILRQKWLLKRSHREVARSLFVSPGVVGSALARAAKAGLHEWDEIEQLDDDALEERLYGRKLDPARPVPDCAWIHAEADKKHDRAIPRSLDHQHALPSPDPLFIVGPTRQSAVSFVRFASPRCWFRQRPPQSH